MSGADAKLANPPIIEAVVDIDCDMPPSVEMTLLETPARDSFRDRYPKFRPVYRQRAQIGLSAGEPPQVSAQQAIQAFQLSQDDGKQIVQIRADGYSFNRLTPYTTLDEYLPEIERTWRLFLTIATPFQIRRVGLHYINRLTLPLVNGMVQLADYLEIGPRLPDEKELTFVGFVNQHSAVEKATGNLVNTILATQPEEPGRLPLIFDIDVSREVALEPEKWDEILAQIRSLRKLKNRVFRNTLTARCLEMFQ